MEVREQEDKRSESCFVMKQIRMPVILCESMLTFIWSLIAREFKEPSKVEKQMTAKAGASPNLRSNNGNSIPWITVEAQVKRLQMRIAKAMREGKHRKVKSLQWMLTHSHHAKLRAVKRVTENKGKNTPGVDGIIWNTSEKKIKAVNSFIRRGYKCKPLRRIYIPKKMVRKDLYVFLLSQIELSKLFTCLHSCR